MLLGQVAVQVGGGQAAAVWGGGVMGGLVGYEAGGLDVRTRIVQLARQGWKLISGVASHT